MNFKKFIAMSTLITLTVVSNGVPTFATGQTTAIEHKENTKIEAAKDKEEVLKLTLEDAIKYALEHNKDITIQDIKIEKQQFEYDQNIRDIKSYNRSEQGMMDIPPAIYPAVTPEVSINKELYELGAVERYVNFTLQQSKWDKDMLINDITNKVSKAYYDLLLKQEEKKIAEENLKLAQKQYNDNKLLLDNGQISEHQLLMTKMSVTQAQSAYEAAKTMYEVQLLSFNNVLGANLDTKVILLDNITYSEQETINIEKAIEQAFKNNVSLKAVKENYEIQKLVAEALSIKYPSMTYRYKEQQIAIEEAEKNVQSVESLIEMGLRAAYFNLTSVRDNIGIYEESIELAERSLKLAELNYELGMSTIKEVSEARIALMNAKKSYMNHLHMYNTALIDFQDSMGLGRKN
ncbi:TolC family protein [Alkaliphilus sp. B6464]|uniref:TolC family protein n=1 Tax=Alkaliphilus sp. B6464 TaxID=2731219 RepID=UPI001BACDF86|nr:TolC family protein [Alkaliphilus sp. B6464]QUH19162.1 TolC family protein [Alkaliphilus sp. B6464]